MWVYLRVTAANTILMSTCKGRQGLKFYDTSHHSFGKCVMSDEKAES